MNQWTLICTVQQKKVKYCPFATWWTQDNTTYTQIINLFQIKTYIWKANMATYFHPWKLVASTMPFYVYDTKFDLKLLRFELKTGGKFHHTLLLWRLSLRKTSCQPGQFIQNSKITIFRMPSLFEMAKCSGFGSHRHKLWVGSPHRCSLHLKWVILERARALQVGGKIAPVHNRTELSRNLGKLDKMKKKGK